MERILIGPDDTPYKGGIFSFKILFPQNYPKQCPEIFFTTPIYHVNVNPVNCDGCPLGKVSVSFLNWWDEKSKIREILIKLYTIFELGNPDSPCGIDRAIEMKKNQNF